MLTVAFAAQKGGTGKSTLAVHLAVCAARRRKLVAVFDLDPQKSVLGWSQRRTIRGTGEDVPVFGARAQEVPGMLARAKEQGVDLVILDSPGRADVTATHVMAVADIVLVPCRPFSYDLEASVETAEEVRRAKIARAFFVLNAVPARGSRHTEARAALETLLPVCPVELHHYLAFGDALNDGRSVEELEPKGKAAVEIRALYRWLTKP
jgi:chromosome partitioning protein